MDKIKFNDLLESIDLLFDSNQATIKNKKQFNNIIKSAQVMAKPNHCILCKKMVAGFCNSHTVPRYILENLSINGQLLYSNTLIKLPLLHDDIAINRAGTFHIICHECDRITFRDYEDPNNYSYSPTQKMLAEIALKNHLKMLSKRQVEIELFNNNLFKNSMVQEDHKKTLEVKEMDKHEYLEGIMYAKKVIDKDTNGYYLIDYIELNYVVPIAFQGCIAMISGFDNDLINDIYNNNNKYKIQNLHICIFPFKNCTRIFLFIEDGDSRYSSFYKKYKKMSVTQKLQVINFLVFKYSEEWYASYKVKAILNNPSLKKIVGQTSDPLPMLTTMSEKEAYSQCLHEAIENFCIKDVDKLPNLLHIDLCHEDGILESNNQINAYGGHYDNENT